MAMRGGLRAGVSLAALGLGLGLALTPAPAHAARQSFDASKKVLLRADTITYDNEAAQVSAEGHVEIDYDGRILMAKRVAYNQKTDTVAAIGDVSVLGEDGNVAFADRVVLTDHMRDGIMDGFKALIGKTGRLAATHAAKHGKITYATRAAFTPCKICREEGKATPTWEVKASKVVYDENRHRIYYHDATVEMFGIPVFYSPIFSHSDPTVKHKSGFLRPSGGNSSSLGTFATLPYYLALSDSQDATIAPTLTTKGGYLLRGEYRQRFDAGGLWLQPSVAYGKAAGEYSWHSSVFGDGLIPLTNVWRAGYDMQITSDQTFLKRYNISEEDNLVSDLFLEAIKGRSRFALSGYYFQDLREGRVSAGEIPLVLPQIEYTYIPRQPLMGGDFRFDLSTASVMRNVGVDSQRVSGHMRWQAPFVTDGGQLITFTADLKGDVWRVANDGSNASVADLTGQPIAAGTHYISRGQPLAAIDWRWPFIAPGAVAGNAFVIEPIVQLIGAPYGGNPHGIPNEDSTDFELDETDIFSLDRIPGASLWESGPRANVGLRAEAFFPGGSVEALAGEVLRLKNDPAFAAGSGLSGTRSDLVGRYTIKFPPYVSLTHRVDIDTENGSMQRNEVYLDGSVGRSNVEVSYVHLAQSVALGLPREEVNAQATLGFLDHWAVFAAARRDLENDQMLDTEFGVGWEDDCLGLSISYQRRYTRFLDVPPSTSVIVQIIPKFGGDDGSSQPLFPKHVFSAGQR